MYMYVYEMQNTAEDLKISVLLHNITLTVAIVATMCTGSVLNCSSYITDMYTVERYRIQPYRLILIVLRIIIIIIITRKRAIAKVLQLEGHPTSRSPYPL